MSFTIQLMRNNSEENKINKSLTSVSSISGVLKNDTSIVNPSILIEGSPSALKNCNYMKIDEFGRSYFITDIISLKNNITMINARCDVLQSFASQILANNAIIKRQENDWNLYIDDGAFKVYSDVNVITRAFPNGFASPKFLLAVAGS